MGLGKGTGNPRHTSRRWRRFARRTLIHSAAWSLYSPRYSFAPARCQSGPVIDQEDSACTLRRREIVGLGDDHLFGVVRTHASVQHGVDTTGESTVETGCVSTEPWGLTWEARRPSTRYSVAPARFVIFPYHRCARQASFRMTGAGFQLASTRNVLRPA